MGFLGSSAGKESTCFVEALVQSLGWEDPLERGMATHSRILAWGIPWAEEAGRQRSMGVTNSQTQLSTHMCIECS